MWRHTGSSVGHTMVLPAGQVAVTTFGLSESVALCADTHCSPISACEQVATAVTSQLALYASVSRPVTLTKPKFWSGKTSSMMTLPPPLLT